MIAPMMVLVHVSEMDIISDPTLILGRTVGLFQSRKCLKRKSGGSARTETARLSIGDLEWTIRRIQQALAADSVKRGVY
jgi:hypothetical protein